MSDELYVVWSGGPLLPEHTEYRTSSTLGIAAINPRPNRHRPPVSKLVVRQKRERTQRSPQWLRDVQIALDPWMNGF